MIRMIFIKIIKEYNPNKKRNILVVFDDVIPEMLSNKKFHPIVTEIFIRDRNLNISLIFITQVLHLIILNQKIL